MATQTRNPTSDEAASGTLSGSAGTRWGLVDDYPDTTGADVLTFGTTAASITFGFLYDGASPAHHKRPSTRPHETRTRNLGQAHQISATEAKSLSRSNFKSL